MATKQEHKEIVPISYVASSWEEIKEDLKSGPKEYHIRALVGKHDHFCYLGTPEMNILYQPLVATGNDSMIWIFTSTEESNNVHITNKVTNRSNNPTGQPTYMNLGTSFKPVQKARNVIMLGQQHTFSLDEQDPVSKIFAISTPDERTKVDMFLQPHAKHKMIVAVPSKSPHYVFQLIKHEEPTDD